MQEAYLAAFGDLSRYEPTGKFAAWLTRLTYQQARLQRAAHPARGCHGASGRDGAPGRQEQERARARARDRQPAGSFPHRVRPARPGGHQRHREAASLGVHETTVRTRLYRAHRRLDEDTLRRVRIAQGLVELTPARLDHVVGRVLTHLPRASAGHTPPAP